ncbi:hypothetical protein Vadar_027185 [Vaccinium darrowii]|uniref:Uncharacterized protein n=1 Tax=Vaccinium darrowii TaxID=229202 RepID=A0ACB7YGU4_9ERIC|nr:hypothetical protein Vadar_027185 [Vaccinium darrowii]
MTPKTPTTPTTPGSALSKVTSKRAPIIYSQSAAATRRKPPPPIEKKLECTLEELCHGCAKKIKITRDAISESGFGIWRFGGIEFFFNSLTTHMEREDGFSSDGGGR